MNESIVSVIITAILSPVILFVIQQFYQRRKNKADYGDDLLDVTNKMAASLKQAREELAALESEMKAADKEHDEEVRALQAQWEERQTRMKSRVRELEKVIVKYDISFTLVTHPQVQVTDLKVLSKEDVLASQKMKAIKPEDKR
jgi:hypothetical protein